MAIQNALTAVMTLLPKKGNYDPRREIERMLRGQGDFVLGVVQRLGFVHFARFVFFEFGDVQQFAIITTYDFDFEDYMNVFIDELGPVFDEMLKHVEGAPKTPVRQHRQEFISYVRRIDATNSDTMKNSAEKDPKEIKPERGYALFYSAYPSLSVQHIWKIEKEAYA
jgi:hypothetical protein